MKCSQCEFENPANMKFCGECGSSLRNECPQCGFENPPGFKFCGDCGAPLTRQSSVQKNQSPPPELRPPVSYTPPHLAERIRAVTVTEGERKTITALFADLKGSTALIEGLDPEEAQKIIDPALQLMMDAVHSYEGYVAQALGDGIFALFGAPPAHEDHPQRALYAALRMQETMRRHADALRQQGYPPLLMRVGLNTGEVVLRSIRKDDLHADYVPVGHSTNLAARMEQLASPGSIVVSAYTQRLTDGYFAFKELGPTQIKGVADSLNIYEVLGVGQLRTRLQVAARRGLTRFVGRQREMEQLQQALAQVKEGHGQIVGAMGEPGLGKSRLFYEFKLLSLSDCLVLEADSISHGKASPYLPVIELLKSYFDIQASDDERKRHERVIGKVLGLDRNLEETLPYLFALLGIEEQPSPLQQMDPQIRRRRTFDALKRLFLRESLKQPLVLIFEDLHWIDGETQGFLDIFSESVASSKLLLLTNYRPEYRHEWGQKAYYTQLRLTPLGQAEAKEFLDVLLGTTGGARHASPLRDLKQLILDKTQGTPFFMEEIVQELFEQGVLVRTEAGAALHDRPSAETLHIPTTVQAVLAARIDRLALDEKALLQYLSVIGREFPLSLAKQVVQFSEDELYRLLTSLQRKEFLYEQPAFPEVEYIFKHALTQDVAYGSVLIERRKALHEQTGQAIELLYKENLEEHYTDLAHHYQRSDNTEKAIEYLHLAGQQAVQRSANEEAVTHLTIALELLNTLPETRERDEQELNLQIALGPVVITAKGYTTLEVERAYTRARELCQRIGETPQLFPVLTGLFAFYLIRGKLQLAQELAEQCLSLAQRLQAPDLCLVAHDELGETWFWLGELPLAHSQFERALALADPQQPLYPWAWMDYVSNCQSYAAISLWLLGYPDQALTKNQEALTRARELAHPHTLLSALHWAGMLHQYRGEGRAAQEWVEAEITLATEQGSTDWLAWGTALQGWILAEQGQREEGIVRICQGIAALRAKGAENALVLILTILAEVYKKRGQIEEGLTALAEASGVVNRPRGHLYEAELYRLKGELLLMQAEKLRD